MLVKENIETVNVLLNKVFDFVQTDEEIQQDLVQYSNALRSQVKSEQELQSMLVAYVYERTLESSNKSVIDLFLEKTSDLTKEQKELLSGMNNSISSVFEIKRLIQNGFELNNIINEKTYTTHVLIKMTNFRGIVPGQYLSCRIFPYKDIYYLIGVEQVYPSAAKEAVYRYAVMKQLEKPELLYINNEEKLAEIEKTVSELGSEFSNYFKKEEVITTSQNVDNLLSGFNDFIEKVSSEESENPEKFIELPEKFAYFDVKEVTNGVADPIQAAVNGFSSHEKVYDVGILFDPDSGLLVLPFYGTFKKLFEVEDYKSIKGHKECIIQYFESDRIPPTPILRAYNEHKDKFLSVVQEVLGLEKAPDINELLHKYKEKYFARKTFSALTVLYLSQAFNDLMDIARDKDSSAIASVKVGRNDPCPCGSGKKYKKCCIR